MSVSTAPFAEKVIRSLRHPGERLLIERRRWAESRARRALARNPRLWAWLQDYLAETESTGCSYVDYWTLYDHVSRHGAREVLECGTGASTLVLAAALLEAEESGRSDVRLTSMEDHEQWLEMSQRLLPDELRHLVDFVLSPSVEDCFSLFRGMRYRDIPERPFDFVFVDGPSYEAPDGAVTFDLDLLHILRRSETPVSAIVDKRVSTCYVLQQVLGPERVRFDPSVGIGFVTPSTRNDLRVVRSDVPSRSFSKAYSILGSTRLEFTYEAALGVRTGPS